MQKPLPKKTRKMYCSYCLLIFSSQLGGVFQLGVSFHFESITQQARVFQQGCDFVWEEFPHMGRVLQLESVSQLGSESQVFPSWYRFPLGKQLCVRQASHLGSVSQLGSFPNFMKSREYKMEKPFSEPSKLGKFSRRQSSGIHGNIHPCIKICLFIMFSLFMFQVRTQ